MYEDSLYHHGIKGQKWGVRRYQNKGGSLTATGKARYDGDIVSKKTQPNSSEITSKTGTEQQTKKKIGKKELIGVGMTAVGVGLAAYGGYKLYQFDKQSKARSVAISNATKALNEFKSLQSNPNKPTFSKPTQNISQRTEQKLQTVQKSYNTGKTTVDNIIKIAGQQKFSQASKVNDDYVNNLLKKNVSMLSNF